MRGTDQQQNHMFSYLSPETRVRQDHPLRAIRAMVDVVLAQLSPRFDSMYAAMGRPSIPPEKLLRAQLLQSFSDRMTVLTAGHSNPIQYPRCLNRGGSMGNLSSALQQLRAERKQAQSHVEKLDTAISVIESLNGSGSFGRAGQSTRIISQASRRKMAQAQRARWAKAKRATQSIAIAKTTGSAPVKRTMSTAARKKIAAFQRARWAKIKAQQKKAA